MPISAKIICEIEKKVRDNLPHKADKSLSVGANSFHFFYTASNGTEYVILIPKYEKSLQDYKKQEILLPFIQKLHLPVSVPTGIKVIEKSSLSFAVEEKMDVCWEMGTLINKSKNL